MMRIRPTVPSTKGGPDIFSGDVWIDVIARGEEPSRVRVNVVREAPADGSESEWGPLVTDGEYLASTTEPTR